jgi:hypothetical protein
MKWAIYILLAATMSAWFTLEFLKLREISTEIAMKQFVELAKINKTTLLNPVFNKEEEDK